MGVTVLIGGQWGDEGKGKIIDLLADSVDMVVRSQGGNNAGHTVVRAGVTHRFHLVPSGILSGTTACVIGHGVVLDPRVLLEELAELQAHGVTTERLIISDRAHLVMPYHPLFDRLDEKRRGANRLGTTVRGIGPAYSDKAQRIGLRVGDLMRFNFFIERLRAVIGIKNAMLTGVYGEPAMDVESIIEEYRGYADALRPYVHDIFPVIHQALDDDRRVLLEGAQAVLLDIDLGTYPYVTSSSPTTGGALTGSGIPWQHIDSVIGVFKAYTTRVGAGPLPTEMDEPLAQRLRDLGNEYDTTTGRPRRMGWFDVPVARYAIKTQGITSLALMKLDVLDQLETIRICTGYRVQGELWTHPMANIASLDMAEPVYLELPGWCSSTIGCRSFADLPASCCSFITRLEELCGADIDIISVGPDREQTLMRRSPIPAGDELVELDAEAEAILSLSPN